MSESDSEAFESADEGDQPTNKNGAIPKTAKFSTDDVNETAVNPDTTNHGPTTLPTDSRPDNPDDTITETAPQQEASGGWGSWGLSWGQSLYSSTKTGVRSFAKELGDGLTTVTKTVESVLDVPPPETLLDKNSNDTGSVKSSEDTDKSDQNTDSVSCSESTTSDPKQEEASGSWLGSWHVSKRTTSVSKTGSYVLSGGIDLLENIGKKTMHVLEETDPGLQKTKALLRRGERPNLSVLLNEARARNPAMRTGEESPEQTGDDVFCFPAQFEAMNGSAYLEGLENLSKRCELKLQADLVHLEPEKSRKIKKLISKVQTIIQEINSEEFVSECDSDDGNAPQVSEDLQAALGAFPALFSKPCAKFTERLNSVMSAYEDREDWVKEELATLQSRCIRDLAKLTAFTVDHILRLGNHVATHGEDCLELGVVQLAEHVVRLCSATLTTMDFVRRIYCTAMLKVGGEEVNQAVTAVILEAENAKSYLQDGYLLLIPVLQIITLSESKKDEN